LSVKTTLILTGSEIPFIKDRNKKSFLENWVLETKNGEGIENFHVLNKPLSNAQKYQLYKNAKKLKKEVLNILCVSFNKTFSENHSELFYDTIFGYWLVHAISVFIDRKRLIAPLIKNRSSGIIVYKPRLELQNVVPETGIEATSNFLDDTWNQVFLIKLIEKSKLQNVKYRLYKTPNKISTLKCQKNLLSRWKDICLFLLFHIFYLNKSFMTKKKIFCDLNIQLFKNIIFNNPKILSSFLMLPKLKDRKALFSRNLRNKLFKTKQNQNINEVLDYLKNTMPTSYIENFKYFEKCAEKICLEYKHLNTKILSLHDIIACDKTKFLTAYLREKNNTKLIIAQHGGGAFPAFHGGFEWQTSICDKFFCNGAKNVNLKNSVEGGQIWKRLKKHSYKKNGACLLIIPNNRKYIFEFRSFVLGNQTNQYLKTLLKFISKCNKKIIQEMFVRVFRDKWNIENKIKKGFPLLNIQNDNISFQKSVKNSRVVVFCYKATGVNETLSANIPTILFCRESDWPSDKTSKKDFHILKKVKIYHENYLTASKHLNEIWDNIGDWWYSKNVQEARLHFCEKYANSSPDCFSKLQSLLNEN
jgi:putative transferase (TIGR04331 family)